MSKYLKAYGAIYPDDANILNDKDDPRRPMIIAELKLIRKAKTGDQAATLAEQFGYADPGYGEEFVRRFGAELATQTGGAK